MNEETLFVLALEKPAADRAAFLATACADPDLRRRVAGLLAASDRAGNFLDPVLPTPLAGGADHPTPVVGVRPVDQPDPPGVLAGRYRIVRSLGEGGMGVVYLAEQTAPVRREVALKIVRPGAGTAAVLARFEAERQTLAMMDHPNIAKVLDGGTTPDGRPFFVMELVAGVPVTEFCDGRRLPVRDRLALFVQVCQAVQHAHQKGVIHRDLKPSNVLVAEVDGRPVPKVIDFGVAKAVGARRDDSRGLTEFGMVVGTPEYMAPEQADPAARDVDTRADIYALTVLLYELLTGTTPLDRDRLHRTPILEALRAVREEDPPPPSRRLAAHPRLAEVAAARGTDPGRLVRAVRGELDWVVLKGLDRDPDRRYESASGLAADVRRHLADEPVSAGPPSLRYRAGKFVRRNRRAVANAAVLLAVALTAVAAVAGSRGTAAREQAARRAAVEAEVARIIEEAEAEFRRDRLPDALAAVRRADALLAGGEAGGKLRDRVRRWRADLEMADRLDDLRTAAPEDGDGVFDRAASDPAYRRAFADYGIPVEAADPDPAAAVAASAIADRLVAALDEWAMLKRAAGLPGSDHLFGVARRADPDPWRDRLRVAVMGRDRRALEALAADPAVLDQPPATLFLLGRALNRLCGREAAARVLRLAQRRMPADFWVNESLGLALIRTAPHEAAGYYRAAVALRPGSAGAHLNLGVALGLAVGKEAAAAAEAEFREALRLRPDLAMAHYNLGNSVLKAAGPAAAEGYYRESIRLDPDYGPAHINLGWTLMRQNRYAEAEAAFRTAVRLRPREPMAHAGLASALGWQGRFAAAEVSTHQLIALRPAEPTPHFWLAGCLMARCRTPEAFAALADATRLLGARAPLPKVAPTLPWPLGRAGAKTRAVTR